MSQPPPLVDYNLFEADAPLREALEREGAAWAQDLVHDLGRLAGTQEAIDWGFQANANPPQLRTHDRFGNRIDEVEFHPAWHRLMKVAIGHGLHAMPRATSRCACGARGGVLRLVSGRGRPRMSGVDDLRGCACAPQPTRRRREEGAAHDEPRLRPRPASGVDQ